MRNNHTVNYFQSIKIGGYKTEEVLVTYWVFQKGTYNVQPVLLSFMQLYQAHQWSIYNMRKIKQKSALLSEFHFC